MALLRKIWNWKMGVRICWQDFDSMKWRWHSHGHRPWAVHVTTVTKNLPGSPQSHAPVSQTGQLSAIHSKSSPTHPPFTGTPASGHNTGWHTDSIVKLNRYTLYIVYMIERLYCTESVFFFSNVSIRAVGNTQTSTHWVLVTLARIKAAGAWSYIKIYDKMCSSLTPVAHEPPWLSP